MSRSKRCRTFGEITLLDDHSRDVAAGARPERAPSLHLDHCHDTGRVRGILCPSCNHGLGKVHDDPALLGAAARYLREGVTPGVTADGE